MRIIALLAIAALTGCASPSSVTPYGKDTYLVTVSDVMGMTTSDSLRVKAAQQANAYCVGMGKVMTVQNSTQQGSAGWTSTSSGLVFTCT